MVINNTAIWVTEIVEKEGTGQCLIKGLAIDGDYGFGDEDTRSFEGQVALMSINDKKVIDARINTAHSTRIAGPLWSLRTGHHQDLLEPPFLITNILNLFILKNDSIELRLCSEAHDILSSEGPGNIYPICTPTTFGILEYCSVDKYGLTVFTPNQASNLSFLNGETILFSEWDTPVGMIVG
jgi:hypothetical protein